MIPRLGDGNVLKPECGIILPHSLENDSPSRGRKPRSTKLLFPFTVSLENDSPSRGRKPPPMSKIRDVSPLV